VIEAKDDEPAAESPTAPQASTSSPNDRNMLLMLSGVVLVVAIFVLRGKRKQA
jgi:hypothetical protein